MASHSEQYKKNLRESKEREAWLAGLSKLKCATFLKVTTHLLIPNEGVTVHKRALWKDGHYLGIIERLLCDESVANDLDLPPGSSQRYMPESEYEFIYHPRSD